MMGQATGSGNKPPGKDRVLGDEWEDWEANSAEREIREGKRIFLFLSLVVIVGFILVIYLLWYLILPRFEMYGLTYARILTISIIAVTTFFFLWYILLVAAVLSRKSYLAVCLQSRPNLFFALYPFVMRLARAIGISRDRLSHSFIKVSNKLVGSTPRTGNVLALLPRCLQKDIKHRIKDICAEYPGVVTYTAPGGNVARKIIRDTNPSAIIAVACERDLVSGIKDIAPRIPVIGIPNIRPLGPCKDTSIDLNEFRSAIEFFCSDS